jgi:hypothetical protein
MSGAGCYKDIGNLPGGVVHVQRTPPIQKPLTVGTSLTCGLRESTNAASVMALRTSFFFIATKWFEENIRRVSVKQESGAAGWDA